MGFKMKKPSMTQGTARYKAACEAIKLNRSMDASSLPDGRAKSSAFQKTYEEAYEDAQKLGYTKKGESKEDYIARAKGENMKKYGTTEPTRDSSKAGISKEQLAKNKAKADATAKTEAKTEAKPEAKAEEKPFKPVGFVEQKRKNKTKTTTSQIDYFKPESQRETLEVVKDKKNKTKTTTVSGKNLGLLDKDKKQKPSTKITSKVKKDKEGNVRKEKDTVVADGKVSKRITKYDKEGNVKKSKVKNRKQFSETKVGKFLSGKKNKDEKPSPATKYKSSGTKKKSVASKPSDLLVGNRKNLPDALKAKISAAPKKGCAECNYGKSKCTCK
jgi:hypothetical protein